MTKSRFVFIGLSLTLLVPVLSGALGRASTAGEGGGDSLYKELAVFSEVLTLIRRAYVEETSVEELLDGALEGAADALDPLSGYIPAPAVEGHLAAREIGNRRSGLTVFKQRGITFVVAVAPGSPGDAAGVERSDIIAEIQGRRTRSLPVWEVQRVLAGPAGTDVEMELLRRGESRKTVLTLAAYEPPPPALETRRGAAVLRLAAIDSAAPAAVRRRLEEARAESLDKLLLDLRGVAGDSGPAAYEIGSLFVSGELGGLRRRGEALESYRFDAPPLWTGDLAVLIDRGTMGAAEILATVLRQAAEIRLVGERSFGFAGRQSLESLSDGSRLLLTDAFYTGPDGEPIRQGLMPDVEVDDSVRAFGESEVPLTDLILERGLDTLLESDEPQLEEAA